MKTLFTIVFLYITLISYCQAPGIEWEKSYGGSDSDVANSIYKTTDGGSIITGVTKSSNGDVTGYHGGIDCWVIKLDAMGNLLWQKTLGGSGKDVGESIRQTFDGGYIAAGYTTSNDGDVTGNHGSYDAWVIKLDASGSIEWQKCYGGSGDDEAYSVRQTSDSGYVLACYADSPDGDVTGLHSAGWPDYWIVKLNKDGSVNWEKCFGGQYDEYVKSIEQTLDKGYIVGGSSYSYNVDGLDDNSNSLIIKLDSIGNLQWQQISTGDQYTSDYTEVIKQNSDSSYIRTNNHYYYIGDEEGPTDLDLVSKLDKNGNLLWGRSTPGFYTDLQIVKKGYIISQSLYSDYNYTDYSITKFDTAGNFLWDTSFGGSYNDNPNSISCDSNNSCIVAGASDSRDGVVTGNHGNYDFWIVKLNPEVILPVKLLSFAAQKQNNSTLLQWQTANEINNNYFSIERSPDSKLFTSIGNKQATNSALKSSYSFIDNAPLNGLNYYRLKQVDKDAKFTYSNLVSVDFSNSAATFAVYPNPANSTLNITFPNSNAASEIILYDVNGKKTISEQLASNITSKQINISKLPAGVYNVVLLQDGKQQTVKMVKK